MMRTNGWRQLLTVCVTLGLAANELRCTSGRDPAAESESDRTAGDSSTIDDIAPAGGVPPSLSNLTCTPEIGPTDTLQISITAPHGPAFHVVDPASTPFFVIFSGDGGGQRRSLMPADSFVQLTSLSIVPRAFSASVWIAGRDTNERVFTRPGTYRLRVGSEMESDGPVYAECLVRYVP